MPEPTEAQMNAAHGAYEDVLQRWQLRRVSNYGIAGEIWLVENIGRRRFDPGALNEIAGHKFDGPKAEERAKFMLRDKALTAAIKAALAA